MISVEETLKVFPCKKEYLASFDLVPFSRELLYICSEKENPFILFPAFHVCASLPLTILHLHDLITLRKYDLFLPFPQELEIMKPAFFAKTTCEPRWYLLSKEVMGMKLLKKFCAETDYDYRNFRAAPAVVYIYAWMLFKILRKETLFLENTLYTGDKYADRMRAGTACLNFKSGKIRIDNWLSADLDRASTAPSVNPYTE